MALAISLAPTAFAQGTVPLPKGQIQALDFTNMTFTVAVKDSNMTVYITPETRFFKNGKFAISRDLAVGDTVHGTMHKTAEGKNQAVRVYTGQAGSAKPAKPAKPAK